MPIIKLIILDRGKVVIREGSTPMTVYFIVSGEIEASKKEYDSVSIFLYKIKPFFAVT